MYEVSLILSKDTGQDSGPRQAMVTVEIDVGVRTSKRIYLSLLLPAAEINSMSAYSTAKAVKIIL